MSAHPPSARPRFEWKRPEFLFDAVCAAWVLLIWFWPPAYLTLTVDDSFYYLRIAENVANGLGPTFDGVEPTNGFHPLWMGLLSALALLPLETADAMRLAL